MPDDPNEYFAHEFLERGIFRPDEIAAGCHCMTPAYLADQLDRSLRNFGVECLDVFYLHNPETQLTEVPPEEFRSPNSRGFCVFGVSCGVRKDRRVRYGDLERISRRTKIAGISFIAEMAEIAREEAGASHHFRFVQLPLNLAMPEALLRANQIVEGKTMAMVQAGRALGITLISSASLLQGQLTRNLPPYIHAALELKDDSLCALQFVRSVPGVTTALVGMSQVPHVSANLLLVSMEPAPRDQFLKLFESQR